MKKSGVLLLAIAFFTNLQAQEFWIETGLKGGYGLSFLYNQNIVDDDTYEYQLSTGYNFGARLSMNFGPFHCIDVEGLLGAYSQDFEFSLPTSESKLKNNIEWKTLDTYLLYRYIRNRSYVEVGPMLSFSRSVEQAADGGDFQPATDYYSNQYLSGVFGFGGFIAGTETFSVGLGLRFHYGLTDFVNDEGKTLGYPNPFHQGAYSSDKTTRPAFAEVMVEFNFGLGHWAKTSCGQRFKKAKRQ